MTSPLLTTLTSWQLPRKFCHPRFTSQDTFLGPCRWHNGKLLIDTCFIRNNFIPPNSTSTRYSSIITQAPLCHTQTVATSKRSYSLDLEEDVAALYIPINAKQLANARKITQEIRKAIANKAQGMFMGFEHLGEVVGEVRAGGSAGQLATALIDRNCILS